jgi:hypothetical protein
MISAQLNINQLIATIFASVAALLGSVGGVGGL